MSALSRDIRYAIRSLRRSPAFVGLAIFTLAIGIGGTTALFSLVDAVVLRALPFPEPHRLVELWGENDQRGGMQVPEPIVEALRAQSRTLEAIAIHGPTRGVMRGTDGAVYVSGERVSANFLDVFRVAPLIGRGFLPGEDRPGAPAALIATFSFWQRHLGGDPSILGRTIALDGIPYIVVGVMPSTFRTDFRSTDKEYWTTYVGDRLRAFEREEGNELVARLAPGATIDAARRELRVIAASAAIAAAADPAATDASAALAAWRAPGGRRLGIVPLHDEVVRDSAYALQLLLAAVGIVLAIACANLAQLLLARSDRRVGEFAIRKAMGASPAQVFRLALVESLMLAAAGGAAGVLLARWLVPVLLAAAPSRIPRLAEAAVDARVLAMAVGLTALTGCAFGLAPALRLSRLSVVEAMKHAPGSRSGGAGGTGPSRARFRSTLVVVQVAASVTLCALAGLVGRTFLTLLPSDPGFAAQSRSTYSLLVAPELFKTPLDRLGQIDALKSRLEAVPGVAAVGLSSNIPFTNFQLDRPIVSLDDPSLSLKADVRAASTNLFQILEMPLLRGRGFTVADGIDSPGVAIVNQQLACRLSPDGDVLGHRLRVGGSASASAYEIVGVVADARSLGTSADILNEIYIPQSQSRSSLLYLVIQSPLDPSTLTAAIRREVRIAMPDLPIRSDQIATSIDDLMRQSLAGPRFRATLMSAFSATALLLATIGLFGLVAYSVAQRRQELGIRAALGARPRDLMMTTMRSAVMLAGIGVLCGVVMGAYLTRFIKSQLYAVAPLDVPTFAAAAVLMLVAAGLAAYVPARRALRADPMIALRGD